METTLFHKELIDKTKALHDEAEKMQIINKIFTESIDLKEYELYLQNMLALHKTIEENAKIYEDDFKEFGLNITDYFRLNLILKDLEILDANLINSSKQLQKPFETFEEALGFMYVLTGSMMGGNILAKKIDSRFNDSLNIIPNNYFLAFKQNNPTMWMNFLSKLNEIAQNKEEPQKENIITGAINAFKFIIQNMDSTK